jgi:cytidylate kinase
MLILLVGPKGSGKSHVGRLLEARLGVHFFHVEPHWMRYHAECAEAGRPVSIPEGIERVRPAIEAALREHGRITVETTGASREILDDLLALGARHGRLLVRVAAPLDICLERIAHRDPTHQIPLAEEQIRQIHELSEAVELPYDLVLDNLDLSEEAILECFAAAGLEGGQGGRSDS